MEEVASGDLPNIFKLAVLSAWAASRFVRDRDSEDLLRGASKTPRGTKASGLA